MFGMESCDLVNGIWIPRDLLGESRPPKAHPGAIYGHMASSYKTFSLLTVHHKIKTFFPTYGSLLLPYCSSQVCHPKQPWVDSSKTANQNKYFFPLSWSLRWFCHGYDKTHHTLSWIPNSFWIFNIEYKQLNKQTNAKHFQDF